MPTTTTLTPTRAEGATTKAAPLVYGGPGTTVTDADLAAALPDVPGVNMPFLADFLSALLAHERCGRHLYRSVASRTSNPVLQRRYEELGEETERHVAILEELVASTGGNPAYVSPPARAVEGMDSKVLESSFLLDGSLDVLTREMAMLDAVFVAESIDQANWATLAALARELPDGDLKDRFLVATAEVAAQEDEHLTWARDMRRKVVVLQAQNSFVTQLGAKAEEVVARLRSWLP